MLAAIRSRSRGSGRLVAGAVIVGGAKLVEFMGDASPSVSY
jgi:hypothetical protein